jgi:uncharacterized protein YjbJ (UPF0337 family)
MNDDPIHGRWKDEAFRSRLRSTWGRLTDEDLGRENADREFVIDKVREYYGYSREHADELVRDFERSL